MQNPITKKSQQGFTLIELLIVVAIIGILAAIAIPQYAQYRTSAMNSAAESEMKNVQTSLEGYYTTSGNYNYPPGYTGKNTISSDVGEIDFDTSDSVTVNYENPAGNQTYAICAYHDGGDTQFAVNSSMSSSVSSDCTITDSGGSCDGCNYPSSSDY